MNECSNEYNGQKGNSNQPIFSTTIMDKKKNINFKVIKNKEKKYLKLNGKFINKNNNQKNIKIINKNNYFSEDLTKLDFGGNIFQNAIIDSQNFNNINNKDPRNLSESYFNNKLRFEELLNYGSNMNGYANIGYQNMMKNAAYFNFMNQQQMLKNFEVDPTAQQIQNNNGHLMEPPTLNQKIRIFDRENFNYIGMLVKAADNLFEGGYTLKDKEAFSNFTAQNQPDQNKKNENIIKETESNYSSDKNCNKDISTEKCENKFCDSHKTLKKIKICKVKVNNNKILKICQKCNNAWNKGQYCYYCLAIYSDVGSSDYGDGKDWIECDSCASWNHIQCEEKKGTYTNLHKLNNDDNFKYFCPNCKEKKSSKNSKDLIGKKRNKSSNDKNCYRKEYNFSLKYSNSKRIAEIRKKMNEKEKKEQIEVDSKNKKSEVVDSKNNTISKDINPKKKIANGKKAKDSNTNLNSQGKIKNKKLDKDKDLNKTK